jgi:hypothetical protein
MRGPISAKVLSGAVFFIVGVSVTLALELLLPWWREDTSVGGAVVFAVLVALPNAIFFAWWMTRQLPDVESVWWSLSWREHREVARAVQRGAAVDDERKASAVIDVVDRARTSRFWAAAEDHANRAEALALQVLGSGGARV